MKSNKERTERYLMEDLNIDMLKTNQNGSIQNILINVHLHSFTHK